MSARIPLSPSRRTLAGLTGLALLAAAPLAGQVATGPGPAAAVDPVGPTVKVDLLALNDFHGQLEPVPPDTRPGRSSNGEIVDKGVEYAAGGAEYLATHLQRLRQESRARGARPFTVAAGDLIGATPLLSAAFYDEPAIEAMNLVGLQVASVGNHEFDAGYRNLQRLQAGGCVDDGDGANNRNSCPLPDDPFTGAEFDYLAANVHEVATGRTVLPPYKIKTVQQQKIAFVGMTLEDTPNIVTKEGVEGLRFTDEVETVDRLVPVLKAKGAEAIVVLLHEGVRPVTTTDIDGCDRPAGPGYEVGRALHPEVDVVVSGHSHLPYLCVVSDPAGQPRLLTSASSVGRVVTEINLEIDPTTGDVLRDRFGVDNHVITNADGTPADAAVTDLIADYRAVLGTIADRVLGQIAPADSQDVLSRAPDADGLDSALGNLIADSQKLDPSTVPAGGRPAQIAFMNPGGIRDDLRENTAGDVTFGAAFSVQPFSNYVVSMDLTGQQVLDVLNEQWNGRNEGTGLKVLQVSGLSYRWDASEAAAVGADALVGPVLVDADRDPATPPTELDPAATYRVVVNSFLAGGGDGFATLARGTAVHFGGLDIDALAAHLAANSPYQPTPTDRISSQP